MQNLFPVKPLQSSQAGPAHGATVLIDPTEILQKPGASFGQKRNPDLIWKMIGTGNICLLEQFLLFSTGSFISRSQISR